MRIVNHLFEQQQGVNYIPCPKNRIPFTIGALDTIVIHYTAGRSGESSAKYLARDDINPSAHIILDRSGVIYQLVPFNIIASHAGRSSYQEKKGFNKYSIGIEIDNAGSLEKVGNQYKSWFGKKYNENEVLQAIHRNEKMPCFWHTYTEEQIEKTIEICELLITTYPSIKRILGHEEISKGRKRDPGPAFPLDKIRNTFFEDRSEETANEFTDEGYVDVPHLNIRKIPSVRGNVISSPLTKGTKVKVLKKQNGWYKVKTEIEGWVAADYIELD